MDKLYLAELLIKYEKGELTKEEHQYLISYYDLFETEPDAWISIDESGKAKLKNEIYNVIQNKITGEEKPRKRILFLNKWVLRAAAAAVLIGFFSIIYLSGNNPIPQKEVAAQPTIPKKSNRFFSLPDGSTVILNADSKLNYPSSFDRLAKREIYLEGEAYFDIRHDASKPFIVHTGNLETTVLGTAFKIKAYPQEAEITVAVSRGKVKVSNEEKTLAVLLRHQQVTYNKSTARSVQNSVTDSLSFFDWKNQDLIFDDLTLADALSLLEKRYDIRIVIRNKAISSNRFTTIFPANENLENVLKSICEFNETTYLYSKENGKEIIIIQ